MSKGDPVVGATPGGERGPSQTDVVVEEVKRLIVDGGLRPGDRLPVEKDLATQFGVSRGSLREGVRVLAAMGVLEVRQGAGTFVSALDSGLLVSSLQFVTDLHSPEGAADLHAVRRYLETEAAGLAAARASDEHLAAAREVLDRFEELLAATPFDEAAGLEADLAFHRVIGQAGGNPMLAALIEALSSQTVRARMWRAITEEGVGRRTHQEHLDILRAVADRDPERARMRMSLHLLAVEDYVKAGTPAGPAAPPLRPV